LPKIVVEVEDVNGSFKRLMVQAPKQARRFLSTAVFSTGAAVQRTMEATAPFGPEGEGATPSDHIKLDIEHRGRHGGLSARVGVFDDEGQVAVATFNEYAPNRQPFMKAAAINESGEFVARAVKALQQCERVLSQGW
jgi:hypothetical protein